MFFSLLHHHEAVTRCDAAQSTEFWQRWSIVLTKEVNSGLLLGNNPLFLPDLPNLERWIVGGINLADPKRSNFEFIPLPQVQTKERWALLLTPDWQLLLVSTDSGEALFSFHPQVIGIALDVLLDMIKQHNPATKLTAHLRSLVLQLPEYRVLANLIGGFLSVIHPMEVVIPELNDADILQSLIHEVRTPLTTIRTLVHSLLKRNDLSPPVRERLEQIDRESKEQIERLNLIFQIVEHSPPIAREPLYLQDLLDRQLPHWQWQTNRRNLLLEYNPTMTDLPPIISNRALLEQLLNALIDRLFRLLPPSSKIHLQVYPAGSFIKLEITTTTLGSHPLRPIGRWLLLQPETGVISLSLVVTKALFQSLGGKLTLKTLPTLEIITVFLPVLPG